MRRLVCHTRRWSLLLLLLALLPLQLAATEAYRFAGVERVVAVGDIHGALDELVAILQGTGLLDDELNWIGGRAHLVSVGDQLDRGDHGRGVLELLMRLESQAGEAGGAVHVVLGNHEVMNLTGDLRYVSAGDYAQFGDSSHAGLPAGFLERRAAFAPDGMYGRWLLDKPVAIVIDDTLFVHGGLSAKLEGRSLEDLNRRLRDDVRVVAQGWHALLEAGLLSDADDFDALMAQAAALAQGSPDEPLAELGTAMAAALDGLPFDPDGPLWYRGSARCHPYVEGELTERMLRQFGARRMVIGHTPTHDRRISSRMAGQVLRVDTGINHAAYQGRPAALVIDQGAAHAWYAGEGLAEIPAESNRAWDRPYGMSDAEIEDFLRNAIVTSIEPQQGEATQRRLTLERDGRSLQAVFSTVDSMPGLQHGRWTRGADGAERYVHGIAAYRLDRLLDLQLVPVSVEREIDGVKGMLRHLPEGSFSEDKRQARQLAFSGDCELGAQYRLMSVFDLLIFNRSPKLGELRYDRYWRIWLMDQSRAFGTPRDFSAVLRRSELRPTAPMAAALERVTGENLAVMSSYLHHRQVEALVSRAALLRSQR